MWDISLHIKHVFDSQWTSKIQFISYNTYLKLLQDTKVKMAIHLSYLCVYT